MTLQQIKDYISEIPEYYDNAEICVSNEDDTLLDSNILYVTDIQYSPGDTSEITLISSIIGNTSNG